MTAFALASLAALLQAAAAFGGPITPNLYECSTADESIRYAPATPNSSASLVYNKSGEAPLQVQAPKSEQISVGTLVSFQTRQIADKSISTLSLLLPTVNLSADTPNASFSAPLITTVAQTTIAGPGPIEGPLSDSTSENAVCTARLIRGK